MSEAYAPPVGPARHRKRTLLILFTVLTLVVVAVVFVFVDHAVANGIFSSGTGNCGGG